MQKKALSPIITTILLVLIAIILAVIIFVWAVAFRGEQITKFYGGEAKDIRLSCDSVLFSAELSGSSISIVNTGDVPIYRFDIQTQGNVNSEIIPVTTESSRVNPGQAATIAAPNTQGVNELHIIPIFLGTDKDGKEKEASCISSGMEQVIKIT
jgi:flagellin-like protein